MSALLTWLLGLLSIWWIWVPIVGVLLYLTYQNNRRIKQLDKQEAVLLTLEVPRTNDKTAQAAEQLFASLHGMLRGKKELISEGEIQEHLGFELVASNKQIRFYIWTPTHLQSFVEGQIYAQYPSAQIRVAHDDYASRPLKDQTASIAELTLTDNDALPIKTFDNFEVDPLAALIAALAKVGDGEELWVQILARPVADNWHQKSTRYIRRLKNGSGPGVGDWTSVLNVAAKSFQLLSKPPEQTYSNPSVELSERDRSRIDAVEKKSTKLGYQVKIRLAYIGTDQTTAKQHMLALVGTFKQFNAVHLNGFTQKSTKSDPEGLAAYKARFFLDKGFVLNIQELASLYHLPHANVETPGVVWAHAKSTEPPATLPALTGNSGNDALISAFGVTDFRSSKQQFGLNREDRGRHVYVLGQTGVGKSKLLELLALSDLYHNQGYAIIDPHGDFAVDNLQFVPPSRVQDVVYFNPTDTEYPIGFNPMEVTDPALKGHVSSELVGVLKRMFGDAWSQHLEYILRNTVLALVDHPGSTMLDITRMLTDDGFRAQVIKNISDPVIKNFWQHEYAGWSKQHSAKAIAPVLNKVGAFTANPLVRNIIGQPHSTFNLRQIMDEGKIFVANLSRGLLGEDNAAILGALLVTKIQLAAMSRANIVNVAERRPFYLYVDEFQHFATDSFVPILSEARKYGLNLTMANQYISQMSPTVRSAVFGNVGTIIAFRVSTDDAPDLAKHFEPKFESSDLTQLHNRNFVVSMTIEGEKATAFTGTTLTLPVVQQNYMAEIMAHTRTTYAQPRARVEERIQTQAMLSKLHDEQHAHKLAHQVLKKQPRRYLKDTLEGFQAPEAKTPFRLASQPDEQEQVFRIR